MAILPASFARRLVMKPVHITIAILILVTGVALGIFLTLSQPPVAISQFNTPATDSVSFNGAVNAIIRVGDTVYVGGAFTQAGEARGMGAALDISSGAANESFPNIDGEVSVVIPDGSGGWYVGGQFARVGESVRGGIVHIQSDGSLAALDLIFGGPVHALAASGTTLYVGGAFEDVDGTTRMNLAAIDTVSGSLLPWDPEADTTVRTIELTSSTVYIGGFFSTIGGESRSKIAAVDPLIGVATAWNPGVTGSVYDIAVTGTTLYAAGSFTAAGGAVRTSIVALDTGSNDALAWNPVVARLTEVTPFVSSIFLQATTVYAGGGFATIGGLTRNNIAAIDTVSGIATDWNPNADGTVLALAHADGVMYAGGSFTSIGGQTRNRIAGISLDSGLATAWNPNAGGSVNALGIQGSVIYAGGTFTLMGAETRNRLAAIDAETGQLEAWNPDASGLVYALETDGSVLYAGGYFTSIGNASRTRIAAIDLSTGLPTAWHPVSNQGVLALEMGEGVLYAGGQFTNIGSATRTRIAALDTSTGLATAWNPTVANDVHTILYASSTVYIGGRFTTVNETARGYIAALNTATGTITAWNPNADFTVDALATDGNLIYAGGAFTTIGGQSRTRLAALDEGGLATSWNPQLDFPVYALAISGSSVYIGGQFSVVNDSYANYYLTAINTVTATSTAWAPLPNNYPRSIYVTSSVVYAGGDFTSTGYSFSSNFASFSMSSLGFASTSGSGLESTTSVRITVALSQTNTSPVIFAYGVTSGTATGAGIDYVFASGTAAIAAGATSTTLALEVVNDGASEADETIIISLSNIQNGEPGSQLSFTYTIEDDEVAPGVTIGQSESSTRVEEGGVGDSYTIVLDTQLSDEVIVRVTPNTGLTVSPTTTIFTALTWNIPQTVSVSADQDTVYAATTSIAILHSASSTDTDYHELAISPVSVIFTDDELPPGGRGGGSPVGGEGGGVGGGYASSSVEWPAATTSSEGRNGSATSSIQEPVSQTTTQLLPDSLVKSMDDRSFKTQGDSTVYFFGSDGKKHAFPNEKVYFSWYPNYEDLQIVAPKTLTAIPSGKNVTYKPGVKLVKFKDSPKVYAVAKGGALRWITTEAIAIELYGSNWAQQVDDVEEAFRADYTIGTNIQRAVDFPRQVEMEAFTSLGEVL